MTPVTIDQALATVLEHHRAGRLAEAQSIYRQVLNQQPNHAGAQYLLGLLANQIGNHEAAAQLILRAISANPGVPEYYSSLGEIYYVLGRADQAIAAFRQAVVLKPDIAETHSNLGVALQATNQFEEAIAAYRRAITLKPDFAEGHYNLAKALRDRGQLVEAISAFRRAIAFKPRLAEAYADLGNALARHGQLEEAITAFRQAIILKPDKAEVHYNLGVVLLGWGQVAEAVIAFRQTIALKSDFAEAYSNLGNALQDGGQLDDAISAFRQAIALRPELAHARTNLGTVLLQCGQLDEAIACHRAALLVQGDSASAHSNLLYTLHFHPDYDAKSIFAENKEFARRHVAPLAAAAAPHDSDGSPNRRLRIGYVSPNFRDQAEAFFVVPLLESPDHDRFEVHCYSDARRPDQVTARLHRNADVWHDVFGDDDVQFAARIRRDRIDVLIDLTMHMARNRALVFARKPAPVQVAWLAYPGGTGLPTMDYRITDAFMDPLGRGDANYFEKSIRLPGCWCCYDPLTDIPGVGVRSPGPIRFGSINNPCKHNVATLRLWTRVMGCVPDSRLLLPFRTDAHREEIRRLFADSGIAPDRLDFVGFVERSAYLRLYDRIDLCLDPLPYNGITTTCDALWMGVPVVSLAGKMPQGRAGLSILSTVDLHELVAGDPDDFVRLVVELAGDLPRLAKLRATLRQRVLDSPLVDARRFAAVLETAYRHMWEAWCQSRA